jgi:hypothetical protein
MADRGHPKTIVFGWTLHDIQKGAPHRRSEKTCQGFSDGLEKKHSHFNHLEIFGGQPCTERGAVQEGEALLRPWAPGDIQKLYNHLLIRTPTEGGRQLLENVLLAEHAFA